MIPKMRISPMTVFLFIELLLVNDQAKIIVIPIPAMDPAI
jgi:hypothetical protein